MQAHLAQQRQALPASPDRACVQMCVTGRGPHMSQGWESFAQRLVTCGRLTVWSLRLSCICNPPPASCCTSLRTAPASCCTSCAVEGVNQASCLLPLSCADTTCRIASLVPMCQCGGLHHTVKQVHVTQYSHPRVEHVYSVILFWGTPLWLPAWFLPGFLAQISREPGQYPLLGTQG